MGLSLASRSSIAFRSRGLVSARASVAQSPVEVLLGAQKLQVLERAERDLVEMCSEVPEDERARCWEVYQYLTSKRGGAQSACLRELEHEGAPGAGCQAFDTLERTVYDLMASGRVAALYSVLKVEAGMAKRGGRAAPAAPEARSAEAGEARAHEDHIAHLRARADELFGAMDTESKGYVDREGFITAMGLLRDELGWDEDELGTVFDAIDCHGHVTREQFADIMVAEELRAPGSDAELLRHLAHSRPSWWSECPRSLGTL